MSLSISVTTTNDAGELVTTDFETDLSQESGIAVSIQDQNLTVNRFDPITTDLSWLSSSFGDFFSSDTFNFSSSTKTNVAGKSAAVTTTALNTETTQDSSKGTVETTDGDMATIIGDNFNINVPNGAVENIVQVIDGEVTIDGEKVEVTLGENVSAETGEDVEGEDAEVVIDIPEIDVPKVDIPEIDIPEINVPEVDLSEIKVEISDILKQTNESFQDALDLINEDISETLEETTNKLAEEFESFGEEQEKLQATIDEAMSQIQSIDTSNLIDDIII